MLTVWTLTGPDPFEARNLQVILGSPRRIENLTPIFPEAFPTSLIAHHVSHCSISTLCYCNRDRTVCLT
jgi:hypothetical protein